MSSIIQWIKNLINSILTSLGLNDKNGTILLLGLDNAGKTTLLHRLRTNSILQFPPTERPNLETFSVSGINFIGWDLGGHEAVRHLWDDYITEGNSVVFLIDTSDVKRFEEAAEELDALISEGVMDNTPIAVLLNKCDLESAMDSDTVAKAIGYEELAMRHGEDRIAMFRISVLRGEGYQEAFRWIATFL
mmetsp:Transcript_18524/g.27092  ORF Transcript_18524/g.27092 Transcript_18524/m.27092 type:complete len:190 (-) Transcript_18524:495-1064(-)|eukprot:CAMPEP_0195528422 /NCGR_PEP_ID=MMETSP0794_2-20130614/30544_1 /TAXON_ID=515487 /ORGANISM="Stephanopyxis turris, Strain CCMP 815" /LENGTH=189 /DNA_ID=CAMNT_0040659551 /DNA_START=137 /DNA_END=706 /DNA_ORIENTATION=+